MNIPLPMCKTQPTNENSSPPPKSRRPLISPGHQNTLLVSTTCLLVLMCCYWWYRGGHRGELIEIDRAPPLRAKFQVNINKADWPELIQLPGLGEILAKRLMAERNSNGPFRDLDELVRVHGIGERTLEKLRPYLLPIPKDTDWAATEDNRTDSIP
ncbi:MAG: helix-hairpin-helix domain-containing protein [Planctomycetes bacterium]|nr:helix-hairpin-helix domain-containing protein [Planctomycetota bacterium]